MPTNYSAAIALLRRDAAAMASCRPLVHEPVDTFIRASQFHSEARLSKLRPAANLRPAIEKRRALFQEGRADHPRIA